MKQVDFDKIERYINGKVSETERIYVESLFLDGENNMYLRNCLQKEWGLMLGETTPSEANLSHLLDRVHHMIRENENLKRHKPWQKLIQIYMKAAAILLIPLLIAGGLFYSYLGLSTRVKADNQANATIFAPMGSRVSFILPDGTIGMLNSNSKLSYALPFTNKRHIKIEGEAWFEVSHDEKHPFEINTGNSTVKVLGTSFNLSAYPENNYVEIVLRDGKVDFLYKGNEKVTVLPSEKMVFQNEKIIKSVDDPEKYMSWTKGKLVLRGDSMLEVIRRIERWYNVEIILADSELEKYTFRGTFEDDKFEDIIKYLAMTSPISYKISPRELMPDGLYKKAKVIINKKEYLPKPKNMAKINGP